MRRMQRLLKRCKLNNEGNTLGVVVMGILLLGILGTLILNATATNYEMKIIDNKSKQNFYYVEKAVDEIYAGIGKDAMKAITDAYEEVLGSMVSVDEETGKYRTMTEEEAIKAIFTGIEMVSDCKEKGYKILATGEMGIGNTTTSSAVAAALLHCEVAEVTGRGAGLSDEKLIHKQKIITEAIDKYGLKEADALRILETVGGFDIAGLAGVCIGGALYHVPIVLDGVISMVAALLAERIVPGTKDYLIPSHKGKEPAMGRLAKELNVKPVIDGNMALGEGTGAVMMFSLLDIALSVYQDRTTFSDINIEKYERFSNR